MIGRWTRERNLGWTLFSLVIVALFLFPIYWMAATSLKAPTDIFAYPPQLIPKSIHFDAWTNRIFGDPQVMRYVLNSTVIAVGVMVLTLLMAAPTAYALAHLPMRGKSALMLINLSALMFPAIMLATPLFVIFNRLGLTDSYIGLILANTTISLPFCIILLRPFFLSIPPELTEAAEIDGCGRFQAFVRVILPIAKPGLFTAATFSFLFGWGDLIFALTMTSEDSIRPVTAGLWSFLGANTRDWAGAMAFSTLAIVPPLAMFLAAQRHIVAGLTAGGVKG
jgi:multiple sugar transport system permease protein